VLDPDNRRRVRETGCVVWLVATSDVLAARVADSDETRRRPLLAGGEARDVLERLRTVREPAYEAAAHARVDTSARDVDEVADLVLQELERCAA
jgi:shikimate kinase